jgi:uncharacterized protein YbbC (DUF1343 family)
MGSRAFQVFRISLWQSAMQGSPGFNLNLQYLSRIRKSRVTLFRRATVFRGAAYSKRSYLAFAAKSVPFMLAAAVFMQSPECASSEVQLSSSSSHSESVTEANAPTGIDALILHNFSEVAGLRIGLVTNRSVRNSNGQSTIEVLAKAPGLNLVAIFTPEHGLGADREGNIQSSHDAETGLPVYSLYGASRRPLDSMLFGVDAFVIDLQDVGVRFYTYATTMAYVMEAAAAKHIPVIVLDRPNPIAAAGVKGPMLEPGLLSFTGYFSMPVQHGMTLGELALMFNAEKSIGANLSVVRMQNYRRESWYDETGLAWTNPSPNLRTIEEAILYPGVALIEGANVSVGRGTSTPFEIAGVPWIEGHSLLSYLETRGIPGVRFAAADFTPEADRYAHVLCHGVRISLAERSKFNAPRLGIELAAALHRLYPEHFSIDDTASLIGSREIVGAIKAGGDPLEIEKGWQEGLAGFLRVRSKYLLY